VGFNLENYEPFLGQLWELLLLVNERFTGFDEQDGEKIVLLLPSVIEIWKEINHGLQP
jgi:hypothetical protein